MGFKEILDEERKDLQAVKRPYETAAFILFAVLFLQQAYFIIKEITDLMFNNGFSVWNFRVVENLSNFVPRIAATFTNDWIIVIVALLLYAVYWGLIYLLVWNYCRKNGLAKWTWTLMVAYGPALFFIPSFVWFAIYAYRKYIIRFIKRVVVEYKEFDPNHVFPEEETMEVPEVVEELTEVEEPNEEVTERIE